MIGADWRQHHLDGGGGDRQFAFSASSSNGDRGGTGRGRRGGATTVDRYLENLDRMEGDRVSKKARVFQLREEVIKGRLSMEKIATHMEEVLTRAQQVSE